MYVYQNMKQSLNLKYLKSMHCRVVMRMGASPYLDKYHRPLVSTDAILDTRTGVLDRSEGILTWIIEGLDDRWGYS